MNRRSFIFGALGATLPIPALPLSIDRRRHISLRRIVTRLRGLGRRRISVTIDYGKLDPKAAASVIRANWVEHAPGCNAKGKL